MNKSFDFTVRAHYDAKKDLINLTADPKLHPEIAAKGFRVSLRKDTPSEVIIRGELQRAGIIANTADFTPIELEDFALQGRMTTEQLRLIRLLLDSRRNLLIYGPPGSGKTMLVSAMLNYLDQHGLGQLHYLTSEEMTQHLLPSSRVAQYQPRDYSMDNLLRQVGRMVLSGPAVLAVEQAEPEQLDLLNDIVGLARDSFVLATARGRMDRPAPDDDVAGLFAPAIQERLQEGFYGAVIYLHPQHRETPMTIELL